MIIAIALITSIIISFGLFPFIYQINLVNSYSFEPNLFPDSPIKTVYIGRNFTGQNNSYSSPFYSLATLENIEFCKSSIEIKLHKKMFAKCTSLKNVTIPGNVSWSWDENDNIGFFTDGSDYDGIFSDCTALESVIVLSKVYSTSKNMFSGCSSLYSVSFPASLQNIAARTFLGCTSLTKINLKHWNITTIGEAAFSNCNGLEVVQIPNTVSTLMRGAFMNCSKLKCVILPDRLTTLAIDVFKNSTSIEEVYYLTDNLTMGDRYTFEPSPTYGKATLYLRKSVLEKVETIEPWRNFVKKEICPTSNLPYVTFDSTEWSVWSKDIPASIQLNYKVKPELLFDSNITWYNNNPNVVEMQENNDGVKLTALSVGSASITASLSNNQSEIFNVTVKQSIEKIELATDKPIINVGDNTEIKATVVPDNSFNRVVRWSVSDGSVCSLEPTYYNSVILNGLKSGETSVIAECGSEEEGDYARAEFTVKVVLPVSEIRLTPSSILMQINEQSQIKVDIVPEDASDKTIIWKSSDETVAVVNNNGLVSAIGVGDCIISATANDGSGVSATCAVTVKPIIIESITLDPTEWSGATAETFQIKATALPDNAADKSLSWTSSDEKVATVDADGNVTAVGIGECVITATAKDGSGISASCNVKVNPVLVESISLNPSEWTGSINGTFSIAVTALPENATDKSVTWTSSNESVASVDQNGNVSAVGIGECVITATAKDGSGISVSCNVKVSPVLVESISLNPSDWSGTEGESFNIQATVEPDNATDKSLEWSSNDTTIATVDNEGHVSVIREGNCVITVKSTDGSGVSAECIITSYAGIDDLFTDADERFDIYNLQGTLIKADCNSGDLKTLSNGIYILRQGFKSRKIIIR